jgi:hypothetical protein
MHKRIRVAAVAAAFIVGVLAMPAQGGQGASTVCDDGTGPGMEVPLVHDPVTFDIEVGTTGPTYLNVCYSTTPFGNGAPAVTGGVIGINLSTESVYCTPDTTPIVLAVSCSTTDPNPASPGKTVSVSIRIQHLTVGTGPLGAEVGSPDTTAGQVCLRGFTIYGPTGVIGPFNLGACI